MRIFIVSLVTSFIVVMIYSITTPNQLKQIIILRDSLEQANKSTLYYRTQYLKANTQLIELKNRIISNEVIIN